MINGTTCISLHFYISTDKSILVKLSLEHLVYLGNPIFHFILANLPNLRLMVSLRECYLCDTMYIFYVFYVIKVLF